LGGGFGWHDISVLTREQRAFFGHVERPDLISHGGKDEPRCALRLARRGGPDADSSRED
jgi:hypothetical protein